MAEFGSISPIRLLGSNKKGSIGECADLKSEIEDTKGDFAGSECLGSTDSIKVWQLFQTPFETTAQNVLSGQALDESDWGAVSRASNEVEGCYRGVEGRSMSMMGEFYDVRLQGSSSKLDFISTVFGLVNHHEWGALYLNELQELPLDLSIPKRVVESVMGGFFHEKDALLLTQTDLNATGQNRLKYYRWNNPVDRTSLEKDGMLNGQRRIYGNALTLSTPYGVHLAYEDSQVVMLRAPLDQNLLIGVTGKVPIDRIATLGVMAAWRWLSNWTSDRFEQDTLKLYLADYEVVMASAAQTDFAAIARNPDDEQWERVMRYLKKNGKGEFEMEVELLDGNGQVIAYINPRFGVLVQNSEYFQYRG